MTPEQLGADPPLPQHTLTAAVPAEHCELFMRQPALFWCRDWITRNGLALVAKAERALTVEEIGALCVAAGTWPEFEDRRA